MDSSSANAADVAVSQNGASTQYIALDATQSVELFNLSKSTQCSPLKMSTLTQTMEDITKEKGGHIAQDEDVDILSESPVPELSEDDVDSSSDEEIIAELAPAEEDETVYSDPCSSSATLKRKRTYQRKGPLKKKAHNLALNGQLGEVDTDSTPSSTSDLRTEIPDVLEAWDPMYSSKDLENAKQAFSLYFDDEVLDMLLIQTNKYANDTNYRGWYDTTKEELEAFLGILILMSVNPSHHMYLYWSTDKLFNVEEISRVMAFKRFQALLNCLHVADLSQLKKREDGRDWIGKVRPLVDVLNERFRDHYIASSHQSIDESVIPFKRCSSSRQCMSTMPVEGGYRVWRWADAQTGYLLHLRTYESADRSQSADLTIGEDVVLSLAKEIWSGTEVYLGNNFTTTRLLEKLAERGIAATGAVRTRPKGFPNMGRCYKLKQGEYVWRSKGEVTVYLWRDTECVYVMSNFHNPEATVEANPSFSSGVLGGVGCPKAVAEYYAWMDGVRRFDQKLSAYPSGRRSTKGWLQMFYYLLDAAVVNAFLQFDVQHKVTYLMFRLSLGRGLINGQTFRRRSEVTAAYRKKKTGKAAGHQSVGVPEEVRLVGKDHHPQRSATRRRCRWCSTEQREVRTKFLCTACQVPLCVECFKPFHE